MRKRTRGHRSVAANFRTRRDAFVYAYDKAVGEGMDDDAAVEKAAKYADVMTQNMGLLEKPTEAAPDGNLEKAEYYCQKILGKTLSEAAIDWGPLAFSFIAGQIGGAATVAAVEAKGDDKPKAEEINYEEAEEV